jgi:hypothetical protein
VLDVSAQVTIVASSSETLDGLKDYLLRAGLGARGSHDLGAAHSEPCSALVLFPDGFSLDAVRDALERLRREKPGVLSLVITGEPERYGPLARTEGLGRPPIVMPRPAWGWMILDAIRGAAGQREP